MFIPYLQLSCLAFVLFFPAANSYADVYKWVDKDGQIHYSQQLPHGQQAELIKAPPPPAIDPAKAQNKIDALVEQQKADEQASEDKTIQSEKEQERAKQIEANCNAAKQNLKAYQDNPGRRKMDGQGNVTRPTEEERQQKIKESEQKVKEFCQ
jgi:uncharacterized protein DUF4124